MSTKHVLVVLGPNGRRHTINVTQNTSIQEVLEIVCKKQDLDFNEWDLKHYNRIIELTNSVRFSGLPNNASLEMVQSSTPRKETTITVVLQLELGKRLKHEFDSSANLWDVLTYWQNNGEQISVGPLLSDSSGDVESVNDNIQPVCIYMRQEIVGEEQLQKTTLRSLGLTHGAACIRLIHRTQNQLKHQANISAPISRATTSEIDLEEDSLNNEKRQIQSLNRTPAAENAKRKAASPSPPPQLSEQPQQVQEQEMRQQPMEVEEEPDQPLDLGTKQNMDEESEASQRVYVPEYVHPPNKLAQDGELNILGDHDACLYYSGDVSRLNLQVDYDESFYEITKQDVQIRQRDLRQLREEFENAPLRTAEAREAQKQEFRRRILEEHPWTIIRIRFPNRYILQGIFRSDDTIATITTFVRKNLADPSLNFYLLITPPRTILTEEVSLIDQNLTGSAVIYFGCDADGQTSDFLNSELYGKLSCPNAIRDHFQSKLQSSETTNVTPNIEEESEHHAVNSAESEGTSNTKTGGTNEEAKLPTSSTSAPPPESKPAQNSGVVPKWFKK